MDDIGQLETEIVALDEEIERLIETISDKLAAPHKMEDLEDDVARLNTLVNLRFTKVEMANLIEKGAAR